MSNQGYIQKEACHRDQKMIRVSIGKQSIRDQVKAFGTDVFKRLGF
jgi:hypothetical protein